MLDAKGWTQESIADITGLSRTTISSIISGRSGVTADVAVRLAAAFANQPEDWLKWDADYQLSLVDADPQPVERMATFYQQAPVRDMQKRGWIKQTDDPVELESELEKFFGGSVLAGVHFPVATRRTNNLENLNAAEKAWCFMARHLSERLPLPAEFSRDRLGAAEKKLRVLAAYPKEVQKLPQMLAYYGIRFVVVEPLPGAKIDGAAFWHEDHPVIAVSVRWDRIDAFWFTVIHEFMHIKNGDESSFDANLIAESEKGGISITVAPDEAEERANREAAELLVPRSELNSFVSRVSPIYASARIIQFANRIKMHPGIIVGQLQHRGELGYSAHRDLLVRVRTMVTETALTDGWGVTRTTGVTQSARAKS
jgi:HTH-type transcriptional regulator/antitoxin HigA